MGGRRAVRFCDDGEHFWSFGDDFYLRKYDVRRGKALVENKIQPTGVEIPDEDRDRDAFDFFHIEQAVITPDGQSLVVGLNRKLFVFSTATGQERKVLEHDGGHMASLAFAPDSRRMVVCAWGKPVSIKLPDGRTRSSAAANHTATLWNLDSGKVETTILLREGSIGPCDFSPFGSRFAVATRDTPGKVSVYLLDGTLDAILHDVPRQISAVAFGDDGQSLITALADTTAVVWAPESLVEPPPP
jgi:WD40 repeat protein